MLPHGVGARVSNDELWFEDEGCTDLYISVSPPKPAQLATQGLLAHRAGPPPMILYGEGARVSDEEWYERHRSDNRV